MNRSATSSKPSRSSIGTLASVFATLEKTSTEIGSPLNINHMRVLLAVAADEGCEVSSIHNKLDYAESTLSRLVAQLSRYTKGGKVLGAEFIEFVVDPSDRRVHRVHLTDAGNAFLKEITGGL